MFRSRLTLEQYLSSVQDDTATANDPSLDDIGEIQFQEDEGGVEDEDHDNVDIATDIDPSLITIPSDFNDRHEVLVIDGEGNASRLKGKITMSSVYALDYPTRILVPLNQYLQPVKKAVNLFNRFLANVARRPNLCSLDYKEWRVVPDYFKDRIKDYIRKKFLLPPGVDVNKKIMKAVGDKQRGYKYSLRCKYLKQGVTKEELYQLKDRPAVVSDQMWVGFIDHIYSEKFKKFSENGKYARSKYLHSHTKGSKSFAIARDIFVEEKYREHGPIEWFVETHQTKDKAYHDPLTGKLVDSAFSFIKQKTGCDVVFSESTKEAQTIAYHKLLGHEKKGRIRCYGSGVTTSEVNGLGGELRGKGLSLSGSSIVSYLVSELNKVTKHAKLLEQRVDDLQANSTLTSNKPNDLYGEKRNDNEVTNKDNSHLQTLCSSEDINDTSTSQQVEQVQKEASPPQVMMGVQGGIIDRQKLKSFEPQPKRMDMIFDQLRTKTCETVILKEQVEKQLGSGVKTQLVSQELQKESVMKENQNMLLGSEMCSEKRIGSTKDELFMMKISNPSAATLPQKQLVKNLVKNPTRAALQENEGRKEMEDQNMLNIKAAEKKTNILESSSKEIGPRKQLLGTAEIESIVDQVMEENVAFVQKFHRGTRKEFIQCYLVGVVVGEAKCKGRVDPLLTDEILLKKLRMDSTKYCT